MPTYRSITISLISQYDVLIIPEYEPAKASNDPFLTTPKLINHDQSLISIYVPTYPSSQFWISYSISPPHPPGMLYYFKLYIDGNHVVSWGCGRDDGYEGKAVYGLFNPGTSSSRDSGTGIERRALCFGPNATNSDNLTSDDLNKVIEIKVFRSDGRKRIAPLLDEFRRFVKPTKSQTSLRATGNSINLAKAGPLPTDNPRRYYNFSLLDPLDKPFATFRYYYRSWDTMLTMAEQLEALGVISPSPAPSIQSMSVNFHRPTEDTLSPEHSSAYTVDLYAQTHESSKGPSSPQHSGIYTVDTYAQSQETIRAPPSPERSGVNKADSNASHPDQSWPLPPYRLVERAPSPEHSSVNTVDLHASVPGGESWPLPTPTHVEGPLRPDRRSIDTFDLYASVPSRPSSIVYSHRDINGPPSSNRNSVNTVDLYASTNAPEDDTTSTLSTEHSPSATFALVARILDPLNPRPATPPPHTSSPKLAQLPNKIPATDTALNTLRAKESLTSLRRQRFPSPEADTAASMASESGSRNTNMSVLQGVVSSARARSLRRKGGESSAGEQRSAAEEPRLILRPSFEEQMETYGKAKGSVERARQAAEMAKERRNRRF
ncbi:hypothetical protein ACLMJK_008798 [Lecanora helva]